MIDKVKYVEYTNCKRKAWLDDNNVQKPPVPYLITHAANVVTEEVYNALNGCIKIEDSNIDNMVKQTRKLLQEENVVIGDACFKYLDLFCKIDVLEKEGDKYYLYEIKNKAVNDTRETTAYINDLSYQYFVLKRCGIEVEGCYLVFLNKRYVKEDELDYSQLFSVDDLLEEVIDVQDKVDKKVSELREYLKKDYVNFVPNRHCNKCPYRSYCLDDNYSNSIYKIRDLGIIEANNLYISGIKTMQELKQRNYKLYNTLSKEQKLQIEHEIKDKDDYIEYNKLKDYLSKFTGDLYFLDFETIINPIPLKKDDKVNEVIPFQYSLHHYNKGKLKHTEYLGDGIKDPRYDIARRLIEDIPSDVKVVAYHADVEKGIIKYLAKKIPEFSDELNKIANNVIDLEYPFIKTMYYNKRMEGHISLKKVIYAMFPDDEVLNYSKLDTVHKGEEAASLYLKFKNSTKEEITKYRKILLDYCFLDTYSLVKIYEKLSNIVRGK